LQQVQTLPLSNRNHLARRLPEREVVSAMGGA
jgi:hypothetical protein